MDWNMIFELIDPRLLAVVAVCWGIEFVLKHTSSIPDWSIVYIVVIVAIVLTVGLLGWSIESVIKGNLCGSFAVFGHQAVKPSRLRIEQANDLP
ncbi:phage holin family protein [Paenibacillus lautus]|uniref:phage holin family protein n=1 Tax=Paenibacillus lautus TaxID=1401 RepID=UPI003D2A5621